MLQWFLSFPEFTEILFYLGKIQMLVCTPRRIVPVPLTPSIGGDTNIDACK